LGTRGKRGPEKIPRITTVSVRLMSWKERPLVWGQNATSSQTPKGGRGVSGGSWKKE